MKMLLALAMLLAGCSGAPDDQSGEAAINNHAVAIEKAADDDVNATISQIREQSDADNPVETEAGQEGK